MAMVPFFMLFANACCPHPGFHGTHDQGRCQGKRCNVTQIMHGKSPFHGIDVGSWGSPEVVETGTDGADDLIVASRAGFREVYCLNGGGACFQCGSCKPLTDKCIPAYAFSDGSGCSIDFSQRATV